MHLHLLKLVISIQFHEVKISQHSVYIVLRAAKDDVISHAVKKVNGHNGNHKMDCFSICKRCLTYICEILISLPINDVYKKKQV